METLTLWSLILKSPFNKESLKYLCYFSAITAELCLKLNDRFIFCGREVTKRGNLALLGLQFWMISHNVTNSEFETFLDL